MIEDKYPDGTTHVHYINRFGGHWQYWKQTSDTWYYFDLFNFEWEEAHPASWDMPRSVLGEES